MENNQSLAIEAHDLHKAYVKGGTRLEVLKGIELAVVRGERLAIQGKSGSGKTTLLHILGTLDRADGGSLKLFGESAFAGDDQKQSAFRNRHIGFVFQFHHLLPELSALENVMLPQLIGGTPKKTAAKDAAFWLDRVGLTDRALHRPHELSGGEQQRVALARSLVYRPDLILADEPTGNLDSENGKIVQDLLFELHAEVNATLLVATHNDDFAAAMDRRLVLQDGRIVQS